jgi:hypothetical protein
MKCEAFHHLLNLINNHPFTIEIKCKTRVFTVGSRDDEMLRISSLSQREGNAKLCSLSSLFQKL